MKLNYTRFICSTSLSGGNQVDGLPPAAGYGMTRREGLLCYLLEEELRNFVILASIGWGDFVSIARRKMRIKKFLTFKFDFE